MVPQLNERSGGMVPQFNERPGVPHYVQQGLPRQMNARSIMQLFKPNFYTTCNGGLGKGTGAST